MRKQITIPVHPLSKRVLIGDYGMDPIEVDSRDILFSMLSLGQGLRNRRTDKSLAPLTERIDVIVRPETAHHLHRRGRMVGHQLFRWHKDQLCRAAVSAQRHNIEVMGTIRAWLAHYQVTEDDYSLESAYKCWQRFEKKRALKPVFFAKKPVNPAADVATFSGRKIGSLEAWPIEKSTAFAARAIECAASCFRKMPAKLEKHIRFYALSEKSGLLPIEIAEILDTPRRSVAYGIASVRDWLSVDPLAKGMFDKITEDLGKI